MDPTSGKLSLEEANGYTNGHTKTTEYINNE